VTRGGACRDCQLLAALAPRDVRLAARPFLVATYEARSTAWAIIFLTVFLALIVLPIKSKLKHHTILPANLVSDKPFLVTVSSGCASRIDTDSIVNQQRSVLNMLFALFVML
jgi:hypothetical protein